MGENDSDDFCVSKLSSEGQGKVAVVVRNVQRRLAFEQKLYHLQAAKLSRSSQ